MERDLLKMNNITYETIEPFRGYQLKEDSQNFGWDETKRRLLSVERPEGVYLYHKSSGSPSHVLFYSTGNKLLQLSTPYIDKEKISIYPGPLDTQKDLLYFWTAATFMPEQDYSNFSMECFKNSNSTMTKVFQSKLNTNLSNVFKKYLEDKKYDIIFNPTSFKKEGHTYKNVSINWFFQRVVLELYEMKPDYEYSMKLSNDIGIINPTMNLSGTIVAKINKPTLQALTFLGYTLSTTPMTATSKEVEDGNYSQYKTTRKTGKFEHDAIDDVEQAMGNAQGVEIGWASNPQTLK